MAIFGAKRDLSPRRVLEIDVAQMAALAERQLSDAIASFERRDPSLAKIVMAADLRIDAAHQHIEEHAVRILEEKRLTGVKLREVFIAVKVAGELERIGDLAKNTAKRLLVVSQEPPIDSVASGIVRMGRQCLVQFSDVLDAYSNRDVRAAQAVWGADDNIDELYNSLFEEILTAMMRDPKHVNGCTHLVFIAKNFERVGDHATNIAEALHFLVTGDQVAGARPKGDETATTAVPLPNEVV